MPIFEYSVVDHSGRAHVGELEGAGTEDVGHYLHLKGLLLLSLREKKEKTSLQNIQIFGGGFSLTDRQFLFENLATMVRAGLPIPDSIKILREDAEKKVLQEILMNFLFTIEKGDPLSTAMEHYPQHFSSVVRNLIKAGETSGNLDQALHLIATQYRKEHELRKKIIGEMIYPLILIGLSVAVVIFLLVFVVPKLSQFFLQAKLELPFMTKVVIALGNLFTTSPFLTVMFFAGVIAFFVFLTKTAKGKELFSEAVSRFPLTRKFYRQLSLYRYCWTMSTLISSGIGIIDSLDITRNVLPGKSEKKSLEQLKNKLSGGIALGVAMKEESYLFPAIVSGLTTVGERTGNLQDIYATLARFYERNFRDALQNAVKLIEPLLLLVMGGIVGCIALAIVLPIYQFVAAV